MVNITPTTEEITPDLQDDGFSDLDSKKIKNSKLFPMEVKEIANIFDNYATKKTVTTGFLNITLVKILILSIDIIALI